MKKKRNIVQRFRIIFKSSKFCMIKPHIIPIEGLLILEGEDRIFLENWKTSLVFLLQIWDQEAIKSRCLWVKSISSLQLIIQISISNNYSIQLLLIFQINEKLQDKILIPIYSFIFTPFNNQVFSIKYRQIQSIIIYAKRELNEFKPILEERSRPFTVIFSFGIVKHPLLVQQLDIILITSIVEMLSSVQKVSGSLFASIDESFENFTPIRQLGTRLNLRPSYILFGFFICTIVMLGTGIFSHLCVTIFGMIYPSFMTFKALQNRNSNKTKEWLTYWIVFGFFTAFARTVRYFFFFLSLPAYNVFRVLFYLYLFYPKINGAAWIYNNYLRGRLLSVEQQLNKQN